MGAFKIIVGDVEDVLPQLEGPFDAVACDPPYGLEFMGKAWDRGVPGEQIWRLVSDLLRPGAFVAAFGGTRTFHRLACAIEDAGFEIRESLGWLYGSGFPKSLDVSKAIDRMDAREEQSARRYRFTAWVRSTGVTAKQISDATGTNMGGHYTTAASQPAIMTREHLEACRHLLGEVPEWVEREADIRSVESKNFAEREVVGQKTAGIANPKDRDRHTIGGSAAVVVDITAPATGAARKWAGWGTALKPAWEPVIVARKPLAGTVAANVLEHGTGAINVDGCRVGGEDGRWPANLIHDGSEEVLSGFPFTKTGVCLADGASGYDGGLRRRDNRKAANGGDSGSAARFFYCAKASKADRDEGNNHPTVKPTDLMAYLCRLVTPPGGTVLDPFCGSGSTGKAAVREGFGFIGIEREAEYAEIARCRIQAALEGRAPDLFG